MRVNRQLSAIPIEKCCEENRITNLHQLTQQRTSHAMKVVRLLFREALQLQLLSDPT